jgi:diguanylate cyclase (GGDEF)-like protein
MLLNMIAELRQHLFIIALTITGVVIISTSIYSIRAAHHMADIHTPLVDAAMEIKLELAFAQFYLEEFISGRKSITKRDVTSHLEQARWYARAMLSGGQNSEGTFIPLEDNVLRNGIIETVETITQIDMLFQALASDIAKAGQGSEIDRVFEEKFQIASGKADTVEDALLAIIAKTRSRQKVTDLIGLILSVVIFIVAGIYFVARQRLELKLISQLRELATHDELTGIANRRSFNSTLSNEWNHALRAQESLSLVICDIDLFKQYNDALGHQAGDECLRSVAEVMRSILQRPVDSVARYGGEEFAFILPFTDVDGAANMMDRLHDKLRMKKIPHPDSKVSGYVTISAGIASLIPGRESSIEEFISTADGALYRAKDEGRNRTCYYVLS